MRYLTIRFARWIWLACMWGWLAAAPAHAFDLQGHRGARGLMPENTLEGFAAALSVGVTTLELDLGVTKDGVVVVSHDSYLNPDHTRGPDAAFLDRRGPAIRSLSLAELQRYDVGRLKPGTAYAASFPDQRSVDGAKIPTLAQVFDLARRAGAGHVRFNIETKITPDAGGDVADPETFAQAVAAVVTNAGLAPRVTVQSFDWRTLLAFQRIAPDIERSCLTIDRLGRSNIRGGFLGQSSWLAGLDVGNFGGSVPRMAKAAGCAAWSPLYLDLAPGATAEAKALGLKVLPWTVNERADMERLIRDGVDGIITDYPDRLRAAMAAAGIPLPPQARAD